MHDDITDAMINAAMEHCSSLSAGAVREILRLGLPYRVGSIEAVHAAFPALSSALIDRVLDAAVAAIE